MSTLKTNAIQTVAGKPILNSTGSILQVVQVVQNLPLSAGVISWTDVTGLSLSITPSSSSNKILLNMCINTGSNSANTGRYFRLVRDLTAIALGDGSSLGNENATIGDNTAANTNQMASTSMLFLDSPATTSAITYKIQWRNTNNTIYLNRVTGAGSGAYASTISTLTAMEISG